MFGKPYKKSSFAQSNSNEYRSVWIDQILPIIFIPIVWVNIYSFGNDPLQSQGREVQILHCNRLQPRHLHKNDVDKVWPERRGGFTVNEHEGSACDLAGWDKLTAATSYGCSQFCKKCCVSTCLSINLTYFKWIQILWSGAISHILTFQFLKAFNCLIKH